MEQCIMAIDKTCANGYLHRAVYDGTSIVYARIGGKPVHVKAITAGLFNKKSMVVLDENRTRRWGLESSRAYFNRLDKHIGVATYFCNELFSVNSEYSYIIGPDKSFIHRVFRSLLRRRAIIYHEEWNMLNIFRYLNLIKELEGHGILGVKVIWDEDAVNTHLGSLVKQKQLTFG